MRFATLNTHFTTLLAMNALLFALLAMVLYFHFIHSRRRREAALFQRLEN
jgi:hypothetical protein